jgi:hypothetical protein
MSKRVYSDQASMLQKIAEQQSSQPELQPYINNLDKLLGIKTLNTCKITLGATFNIECKTAWCSGCKQNPSVTKELYLDNTIRKGSKKLIINDKDYHWYLTAKKKDKDLFIVIGIPKKSKLEAIKYTLGKDETGATILLKGDNF